MTSVERIVALLEAVRYGPLRQVPGAIVECGVWRGGSTMAALLALSTLQVTDREIYLFDTFEGMPEPSEKDVSHDGVPATKQLATSPRDAGIWARASLEEVKRNVRSTGY